MVTLASLLQSLTLLNEVCGFSHSAQGSVEGSTAGRTVMANLSVKPPCRISGLSEAPLPCPTTWNECRDRRPGRPGPVWHKLMIPVSSCYHEIPWTCGSRAFSWFGKLGSPRPKPRIIWFLVRALCLTSRWPPSHCILTRWKDRQLWFWAFFS